MIPYETLNKVIAKSALENVHLLKPTIDGKELSALYGCKPGKHIGSLLDECFKYQILNLKAGRDEVEEYMIKNKESFLMKYMGNS